MAERLEEVDEFEINHQAQVTRESALLIRLHALNEGLSHHPEGVHVGEFLFSLSRQGVTSRRAEQDLNRWAINGTIEFTRGDTIRWAHVELPPKYGAKPETHW